MVLPSGLVVGVLPEHEYPIVATIRVLHVVWDDSNDSESSTQVESDFWISILAAVQPDEVLRGHALGEPVVSRHSGAEIDTLLVRLDDRMQDAGLDELIACFGPFGDRKVQAKSAVTGVVMSREHPVRTGLQPARGREGASCRRMDDAQCPENPATRIASTKQEVWASVELRLHLVRGPKVILRDRRWPSLRIDPDKILDEPRSVNPLRQEGLNT